jgi:hypothetical protein
MEEPVEDSAGKSPDSHPGYIKGWSAVATSVAEHDPIIGIG